MADHADLEAPKRQHTTTQPGYIDNGTSAYTCQKCWVEVRFTHLDRHDAWHGWLEDLHQWVKGGE